LQDSYAAGRGNLNDIKGKFSQCLNTNAIYDTSGFEIKMSGKTAELKWESKLPIMFNASLLLEFEKTAPTY
jgi:hypothetical protein